MSRLRTPLLATVAPVANLLAVEAENDPDGQGVDSNPFDVQALTGSAALVVDAGANALLRVDRRGHVDVEATFRNDRRSTRNRKELVGRPSGPADLCVVHAPTPGRAEIVRIP